MIRGATVIGITGHSGVGKSFVCKLFKSVIESEFGKPCKILSADEIAFNMRNNNEEIKQQIRSILGESVYDENGVSIPSKINELIFNPANTRLRFRYEMIFNIGIPREVENAIQESPSTVIILDFYCIFSYLEPILDLISTFVLVTCKEETQLQRLTDPTKRNIDPNLAMKRIQSQRRADPEEEAKKRVQLIIHNESETTESQLREIICTFVNKIKL